MWWEPSLRIPQRESLQNRTPASLQNRQNGCIFFRQKSGVHQKNCEKQLKNIAWPGYFIKESLFYFVKLEMVIGNILDKLDRLFYKHSSGLKVLRAKN